MSMLTGQSDKLRKAALIQEEHVHYNMALADDTILSLRYRVRELRAENAKLREERDMYRDLVGCMVHPDISDQLQAEVAALRELVRDFDKCLTEAVRLAYIQGHATIYDSTLLDSLHPRMRELGIEAE